MENRTEPIKVHLYFLQVLFNTGHRWDLHIVAVNTHAVNMWITDQQDSDDLWITKVSIELVLRNYKTENPHFLAKAV